MTTDLALFNDFLEKWPLERVRKMSLDEYTKAKRRAEGEIDTFTYWLEAKLADYGSIWGGSSFKFGIYSRNDEEVKESKGGRMYTEDYAWYAKYGSTKEAAFEKVRSLVVAVIEGVQRDDLRAIDSADLGDVYKWKIAFHYQSDVGNPSVLNIYDPVALRSLARLPRSSRISECQTKLLSTIGDATVLDHAEVLWAAYQKSLVPEIVDSSDNRQENLNTIYYGPPGTGKTYQVLQFLKQIDERTADVNAKSKLRSISSDATFWHLAPGQGGYLWPKLKNGTRLGYQWCSNDYGDLRTARIDNEHRSIIERFASVKQGDYFAVISGYKVLGLAQAKHDYDYSRAITEALDFQTIEVEWIEQFDPPVLLNSTQTMTFCRLNGGTRWDAFVSGLAERGIVMSSDKDNAAEVVDQARVSRNHMLVTFHQSYSYEDFIQGIKPVMEEDGEEENDKSLDYRIEPGVFHRACDFACQKAGFSDLEHALRATKTERKAAFAGAKPFYLVIDEINRGNVANILGELITLMEADKRLGSENEIIVDLPYSKKPFGVPWNLYIIGTMNTADRSVEALDSALRRRFSFIPTYPDSNAIVQPDGLSVDLGKLLDAVNSRIAQILDRDHTIGHGYFTGIKDATDPLASLAEVFRKKVIPQLQEYFFNAPERILQILGKVFVQRARPEYQLFGSTQDQESETWAIGVPPTDSDENRETAERAFMSLYTSDGD